jgi:hypothetical protein
MEKRWVNFMNFTECVYVCTLREEAGVVDPDRMSIGELEAECGDGCINYSNEE